MLGTAAEIRNGASKTTSKIDDKNWIEKQFIYSQTFHRTPGGRVQKTTAGERFKPRILESFDPVTQDQYRASPTTIFTKSDNTNDRESLHDTYAREPHRA
jgi:hypothetical protein